jgi:transposase
MMDNLSAHKGSRLRGIVAGRGCELIYLPPYSSPVSQPYLKEAFAKLKKSLLLEGIALILVCLVRAHLLHSTCSRRPSTLRHYLLVQ